MMETIVRLEQITIENFKNIRKGQLSFANHRKAFRTSILGLYGQNGSGKTALIDAIELLQYALKGLPVPAKFADYISVESDSAAMHYEFSVSADTVKYQAYYDFKLKSEQIEEVQNLGVQMGEETHRKAVIFDEALKGTFKFSTQSIPIELIAVLSSPDAVTEGCTTSEKEEVTVATGGTATLKMAPVAGSVCAYSADACKVGIDTPIANVTVADTTITIPEATEGAKYIVYYLASQANATTVKFSDTLSPGYYSLYGKTNYKGTKNNKCSEYNHFYKLRPQKALNLTYQGTGDPMSLEITFDVLSDDNGDFYDHGRINPKKN